MGRGRAPLSARRVGEQGAGGPRGWADEASLVPAIWELVLR